jgi:hypothetical protein
MPIYPFSPTAPRIDRLVGARVEAFGDGLDFASKVSHEDGVEEAITSGASQKMRELIAPEVELTDADRESGRFLICKAGGTASISARPSMDSYMDIWEAHRDR